MCVDAESNQLNLDEIYMDYWKVSIDPGSIVVEPNVYIRQPVESSSKRGGR